MERLQVEEPRRQHGHLGFQKDGSNTPASTHSEPRERLAGSPPFLSLSGFRSAARLFTHTTPAVSRRLNPNVRIYAAGKARSTTLGASLLGELSQRLTSQIRSSEYQKFTLNWSQAATSQKIPLT